MDTSTDDPNAGSFLRGLPQNLVSTQVVPGTSWIRRRSESIRSVRPGVGGTSFEPLQDAQQRQSDQDEDDAENHDQGGDAERDN